MVAADKPGHGVWPGHSGSRWRPDSGWDTVTVNLKIRVNLRFSQDSDDWQLRLERPCCAGRRVATHGGADSLPREGRRPSTSRWPLDVGRSRGRPPPARRTQGTPRRPSGCRRWLGRRGRSGWAAGVESASSWWETQLYNCRAGNTALQEGRLCLATSLCAPNAGEVLHCVDIPPAGPGACAFKFPVWTPRPQASKPTARGRHRGTAAPRRHRHATASRRRFNCQ